VSWINEIMKTTGLYFIELSQIKNCLNYQSASFFKLVLLIRLTHRTKLSHKLHPLDLSTGQQMLQHYITKPRTNDQ